MHKRDFLKIMGGGLVVAATPACSILDPTPEDALTPWRTAGAAYDEPRRRALSYAILCPNPHNRQPWMVDLSQDDEVVLHIDPERQLPHTDPLSRQITIGLGCFLELLVMAAAADGYRVALTLFPEGANEDGMLDARPVARARFEPDASVPVDPLFAHVLARRSVKEPYDLARPVSDDALIEIAAASAHGSEVGASGDPDSVRTLRTLTHDALRIEVDTPRTYQESVDLFRIGKREVEANPDGIDFTGRAFELMGTLGMFTRETALDRSSTAFKEGEKAVFENVDTAMAHLWLVTPTNDRPAQIRAGRDWLRIHLASTAAGVAMQPLSQCLQEYPEMAALYRRTHELLAPAGGTVQMLARLGHAAPVAPSPRWSLQAIEARRLG